MFLKVISNHYFWLENVAIFFARKPLSEIFNAIEKYFILINRNKKFENDQGIYEKKNKNYSYSFDNPNKIYNPLIFSHFISWAKKGNFLIKIYVFLYLNGLFMFKLKHFAIKKAK